MGERKMISLIVPCYNMADKCDRFFESLLRQTYTDIQLILVDDGSTDNTKDKIMLYKHSLEDAGYTFEYYYQANKGLGGAINTGLKKVKGEYLCWADPDDYYEDNAFEIRVMYFNEHPNCLVLTCDAYYRNADNLDVVVSQAGMHSRHTNEKKQFNYLLDYDSIFCPGCHMIRMDAFRQANPAMDIYEARRGQDWQLLLPVYYTCDRDYYPVAIYNYIIYQESMSHSESDFEKKQKRYEENEKIQIETIKRITMPENERISYIRHIHTFHNKLHMYNARNYGRKKEFHRYYIELKAENELTLKDWMRIIRFKVCGR